MQASKQSVFERLAAKKPAKEQSNQLVPVRLIDNVRQSQNLKISDQPQEMLAIMPASIGPSESYKHQDLALT